MKLLSLCTSMLLATTAAAAAIAANPHSIYRRCPADTTAPDAMPTSIESVSPAPSSLPPATTTTLAPSPVASPTASPPPAPAAPSDDSSSSTSPQKTVTIAPGDTLEKIAAANGVGVCDLARANEIADPNKILAGSTLVVLGLAGDKDNSTCLEAGGV
ncbi:carbohydrate-binding module family 50 protein [Exserohilum turcica Et28A]|uniref:Carbohydrate-binding module family 50 protein n=1 Tax=Exserohilum turcicum (strain 28A) TaxID=671987 RepID=R0KBC1_EXST2|nr:carbohydrate-binding module family 50 protein [Exserohilum turcica Et28A]EOA90223.1 carbohydrate-binding module family 50 protein [Exserohilum turcica Et28A]